MVFIVAAAGPAGECTPSSNDINAVAPLTMVAPKYPGHMVRRPVGATVYSRVEVDASGAVTNVRSRAVTSWSSPGMGEHQWFEEAANDAIRKWRFAADAAPVRVICRETTFNLGD